MNSSFFSQPDVGGKNHVRFLAGKESFENLNYSRSLPASWSKPSLVTVGELGQLQCMGGTVPTWPAGRCTDSRAHLTSGPPGGLQSTRHQDKMGISCVPRAPSQRMLNDKQEDLISTESPGGKQTAF